jgi:DNA-binding YbaB/EbfC family protein
MSERSERARSDDASDDAEEPAELEVLDALDALEDFADLSASAPGLDLGSLLASAQAMQQRLMEAQAEIASEVVEGHAGGGMVRVRVSGGLEFESVVISPEVVDRDDVEMLQDLVLAAIRDAVARANELNQSAFGDLGALGGLGGLGGLPDGGSP